MNNLSVFELVDRYRDKKERGMSFSEIRKSLERQGVHSESIRVIIQSIDNEILKDEKIKSQNKNARELILIGLVLALSGLLITVLTFTRIIAMGNYYLLAYGPLIGGIGIFLKGVSGYRKA